jgi:hypothetical protein
MQTLLRLEELAMFLFSLLIFSSLPYAWWWFPLLLLAPDISMIGYAVNNKTGAVVYNFFHHKALGLLLMGVGYYLRNDACILAGCILFGHSSMDRIFGYGLKYVKGFKFTHLGKIGKEREETGKASKSIIPPG